MEVVVVLTENEWCIINQILLNLYSVNELDDLAKKIMKMIKMLIPYTKGWFLLLNEEQQIVEKDSYFNGFEEDAKESYIHQYYNEDYIQYLYSFEAETKVYRDTNILENDIRKNTVFYKKFLQPEEVVYGCGILIVRNGKNTAVFNLFRDEKFGDFTDKELYILNVLKKHLENMVYNVTQISRANKTMAKNLNLLFARCQKFVVVWQK